MFGTLIVLGLYFLGSVITYYGVYISRVIKYKKWGAAYINCDQYISSHCEEEFDILMYIFWPITIVISFVIFVFKLIFETMGDGIKTLIKKLLKVE